MIRILFRRPGFEDDVFEIARYLAREDEVLARRFIAAVEKTLAAVTADPQIGSPKRFSAPILAGLRSWRVAGFPKHLIFYFYDDETVSVLTVVHGARDLPPLLEKRASTFDG